MNNQEVATLILNCIISLFFLLLGIFSCRVSKKISPIKNLKSDESDDGSRGASTSYQNLDAGEMFKSLAQAIYSLSLGSLIGFILSLIPLVLQACYLATG